MGYPKLSEKSISPLHSFILKRQQHRVTDNDNIELFTSDGVSPQAAFKNQGGMSGQIGGISGSGVFVLGNKGSQKLCSIQYAGDYHNTFRCITLDGLVDPINERLREINTALSPIQCGDKLIKDGEYLSLEDFSDFNFFKEKIKKTALFKKNEEEYKKLSSQSEIKKIGDSTNDELLEIKKQTDELSYKYAYLAILSHENENYHAAARYFKKAAKLNKAHAHTLIYEKASREKNTKKILDMNNKHESAEEKIYRLDDLLENPITSIIERRGAIKKIISILSEIKGNEKKLQAYVDDLIRSYVSDETIRENYKYLELAYSCKHMKEYYDYAIYFFTVAKNITKGLPESKGNKELIKNLSSMIDEGGKLSLERKNDAEEIADNYLREKENHYLSSDIKRMVYDIYDDTYALKMDGEKRRQEAENIECKIKKIDESIKDYQDKNDESSGRLQQTIENTTKSLGNKVDDVLPNLFEKINKDFNEALNSSLNGLDDTSISKEEVKEIVNSNIDEIEKAIVKSQDILLSTASFGDESELLKQQQEKNNKVLEVFFFNINKEIKKLSVSSKYIVSLSQGSLLELSKIKEKLDEKTREAKDSINKIHEDIENKVIASSLLMRKQSASFNRFQYSNILKLEKQISIKFKDMLILFFFIVVIVISLWVVF